MKKSCWVFLLAAMAFMVFASVRQTTGKTYDIKKAEGLIQANPLRQQSEETDEQEFSFRLPASIQFIDDEAFEGTAIQSVQLPESVTAVGDRAFADDKNLLMIQFPKELQQIGKDVLEGSDRAEMAVFAGSDALNRALEEGYRYHMIAAFSKMLSGKAFVMTTGSHTVIREYKQQRSICIAEVKEKRTGRTNAELKGELYRGIAALYVQSRYFP